MLSLTLRQIEYAVAIARHGGVTAAASALNVSQPSLSVALREVERVLGRPLFHRRPGGRVVPTDFGRAWITAAQEQLGGIDRLIAARLDPPLRLAVFLDLAPLVLAPLMAGPGPGFEPLVTDFAALEQALHRGETDLALTWDLGLDARIGRLPVTRIAPHAVLAADHPLAPRPGLTLAELAACPLVLTDQGVSVAHMRGLFLRAGLSPVIAHRTATLDLMRSYAANGLGIGLSYSRPRPDCSPDGRPLVIRPLTDAGNEAVVLAHAGREPPAAAPPLARRIAGLLCP